MSFFSRLSRHFQSVSELVKDCSVIALWRASIMGVVLTVLHVISLVTSIYAFTKIFLFVSDQFH